MQKTVKHLLYVPFTGLGLHNGFRGNRWLKNRIRIFKQFVLPSLQAQTSPDFILWISWRREEKHNPQVVQLKRDLEKLFPVGRLVFTYNGVCFYDDKYPDEEAKLRLINSIHYSMPTLIDTIGGADYILMTIQPSDDLYHKSMVEGIHKMYLAHPDFDAVSFPKGYICNYNTKEVAEYNPETNPPFYTIKFPYDDFTDPYRHSQHTALKSDVGKYKKGTPCPSHEYVGDCLKLINVSDLRGFLVGTHGANISTTYNIPYKGEKVSDEVLKEFGIYHVPPLQIEVSPQKKLLLKLPFRVQRKLRYWLSEKLKINILS